MGTDHSVQVLQIPSFFEASISDIKASVHVSSKEYFYIPMVMRYHMTSNSDIQI